MEIVINLAGDFRSVGAERVGRKTRQETDLPCTSLRRRSQADHRTGDSRLPISQDYASRQIFVQENE